MGSSTVRAVGLTLLLSSACGDGPAAFKLGETRDASAPDMPETTDLDAGASNEGDSGGSRTFDASEPQPGDDGAVPGDGDAVPGDGDAVPGDGDAVEPDGGTTQPNNPLELAASKCVLDPAKVYGIGILSYDPLIYAVQALEEPYTACAGAPGMQSAFVRPDGVLVYYDYDDFSARLFAADGFTRPSVGDAWQLNRSEDEAIALACTQGSPGSNGNLRGSFDNNEFWFVCSNDTASSYQRTGDAKTTEDKIMSVGKNGVAYVRTDNGSGFLWDGAAKTAVQGVPGLNTVVARAKADGFWAVAGSKLYSVAFNGTVTQKGSYAALPDGASEFEPESAVLDANGNLYSQVTVDQESAILKRTADGNAGTYVYGSAQYQANDMSTTPPTVRVIPEFLVSGP